MQNSVKPENVIAKHFYEKVLNKKATKKVYLVTLGQAKALLKAGYSVDDIIQTIDYLVQHPPKNGFRSLAFVQYVINDVLFKIKVKELRERSERAIEALKPENSITNTDISNAEKYLNKAKANIKGVLKI